MRTRESVTRNALRVVLRHLYDVPGREVSRVWMWVRELPK